MNAFVYTKTGFHILYKWYTFKLNCHIKYIFKVNEKYKGIFS